MEEEEEEEEEIIQLDNSVSLICEIDKCYGMDTIIDEFFGKKLTLCSFHADRYKDVLTDISLTKDKQWMKEWVKDNIKVESQEKWI